MEKYHNIKGNVDDILNVFDQNKNNEYSITDQMNNKHKYLEFKLTEEEHNNINYLDFSIHRHNNSLYLRIHRKATQTETTIHFTSNYPLEHTLTAYTVHTNRMIMLPIIQQAKLQEWNITVTIPRNNGFPLQIIHNLKNKLMLITQQTTAIPTHTQ